MIKVAYKLEQVGNEVPKIVKVSVEDVEGVSWKDAKKALRSYFMALVKELRKLNERTYFGND